ncbi:MAG: hypothetical protein ACOZQL_18730 [Myxococcota bacterium]
MSFFRTLAGACLALVSTGCVYGYVADADTTTVISGVKIVADGNCSGAGCGTPIQQLTDANGRFVFDAYGNVNGESNVQIVTAKSGEEAIKLTYSKAGYKTQVVYHQPKYENVTYEGKDYLISPVQKVWLCKTGAADSDADGICNAAEAQFGTNPNSDDTDGDGLSDLVEIYGANGVDLHVYGANPRRRDVFVEVDYYPAFKPAQAALDQVVTAFANAPLTNHDGSTGVSLHLVLSSAIAAADLDMNLSPVWSDFDVIKNKYFAARRAPYFHYLLVANQYDGGGSSGKSRGIPGHDFLMTLGNWSTPGGTVQQQAGTLMHELGHNLGLMHGGNEDLNRKPNYLSIMSYTYQLGGLRVNGTSGVVDYSRLRVASVSEAAVNEASAFGALAPTTEADLANYQVMINGAWRSGTASANLDFNGNGAIAAASYAYDLNGDGDTSDVYVASQNDWSAVVYDGAGTIGADGTSGLPVLHFLRLPEVAPDCATEF